MKTAAKVLVGFVAFEHVMFLVLEMFLWNTADARNKQLFFLGCVLVAGVFGGVTAKLSILFMQGLPAALALAAVYLARDESGASAPA